MEMETFPEYASSTKWSIRVRHTAEIDMGTEKEATLAIGYEAPQVKRRITPDHLSEAWSKLAKKIRSQSHQG
jgi:hypothetical protein